MLALYLLQSFMDQQVAMVIKVPLWLPYGPSYHSNKICGSSLLFQETWVPNIFHSGRHGNPVFIETRYEAEAYCPNESLYQM